MLQAFKANMGAQVSGVSDDMINMLAGQQLVRDSRGGWAERGCMAGTNLDVSIAQQPVRPFDDVLCGVPVFCMSWTPAPPPTLKP